MLDGTIKEAAFNDVLIAVGKFRPEQWVELPLNALINKIPRSMTYGATTVNNVLEAMVGLPAEQRAQLLSALIKQLPNLTGPQGDAAFNNLLEAVAALPHELRSPLLTALKAKFPHMDNSRGKKPHAQHGANEAPPRRYAHHGADEAPPPKPQPPIDNRPFPKIVEEMVAKGLNPKEVKKEFVQLINHGSGAKLEAFGEKYGVNVAGLDGAGRSAFLKAL